MGNEELSGADVQDAAVVEEPPKDTNPNADDFRSMRGVLKEMKGELSALRGENTQLRQSLTTPAKVSKPFEGRDSTDYLTIAEQQEREDVMMAAMKQEKEALMLQTKAVGFFSAHSDYEQVMDKYAKTLPIELREFLVRYPGDPDAMKAAYATCKKSTEYMRDNAPKGDHDNARRASENMGKPGAGSSAGSGGTVSLANKLSSMTKEERVAWSDRCIREGGR